MCVVRFLALPHYRGPPTYWSCRSTVSVLHSKKSVDRWQGLPPHVIMTFFSPRGVTWLWRVQRQWGQVWSLFEHLFEEFKIHPLYTILFFDSLYLLFILLIKWNTSHINLPHFYLLVTVLFVSCQLPQNVQQKKRWLLSVHKEGQEELWVHKRPPVCHPTLQVGPVGGREGHASEKSDETRWPPTTWDSQWCPCTINGTNFGDSTQQRSWWVDMWLWHLLFFVITSLIGEGA